MLRPSQPFCRLTRPREWTTSSPKAAENWWALSMSQQNSNKSDFIDRILAIFEDLQSVDWQKNGQKSKHWRAFNDRKVFTPENIANFRKGKVLSFGLDDSKDFSFRTYALFVSELSEDALLSFMPEKNVGNGNLTYFRNRFVDLNKMYPAYWYSKIQETVFAPTERKHVVCEIGGGYGSFSETILSRENVTQILIDLPEANLLSSYYLHESFPEKRFFLHDDYKKHGVITRQLLADYDVFILPPNCRFSEDVKVDLFINTRSMMEMNMSVISSYFSLIQNHCREGGHFLNVNRYEKRIGGKAIRIAEYPYDKSWDVALSEPSINQPHIHMLLTKRRNSTEAGNIAEELARLSVIGKDFYTSDKPEKLSRNLRKPFKPLYRPLQSALRALRQKD